MTENFDAFMDPLETYVGGKSTLVPRTKKEKSVSLESYVKLETFADV